MNEREEEETQLIAVLKRTFEGTEKHFFVIAKNAFIDFVSAAVITQNALIMFFFLSETSSEWISFVPSRKV